MVLSEGWLPIGSVVHLSGREGMLMVVSVMAKNAETGELFDYAAVEYPGGKTDVDKSVLFNREGVDCVYFLGLQDAEGLRFQDILNAQNEAFQQEKRAAQARVPMEA